MQADAAIGTPSAPGPASAADGVPLSGAGIVRKVIYHNVETGFCVLLVRPDSDEHNLITVVGHSVPLDEGDGISYQGEWVHNPTHGRQLKANFIHVGPPGSLEAMEKYLASGMVNGIGTVYARRLIQAFGEQVFDIIENEPGRLQDVAGIGPGRARAIVESWAEDRTIRTIMVFLHGHGLGGARAYRIYRAYGSRAMQVMQADPYRLARDIRGIGFATSDTIALAAGFTKDNPERLRAALFHVLHESRSEGHCGLPLDIFLQRAKELLEVSPAAINAVFDEEIAAERLHLDRISGIHCVFSPVLFACENRIAHDLRRLSAGALPWSVADPDAAVSAAEQRSGLRFDTEQRAAVLRALTHKLFVITGGPGVGKTTILKAVLDILRPREITISLCAPTGRAAKRMSEATGHEAMTIHRLLEFSPATFEFLRNEDDPLSADLVIVDECSMVDAELMESLLRALRDGAALLIVGDVDQLPSVGPGHVLGDIIVSGSLPVSRLSRIHRQERNSRIVHAAHLINSGEVPDLSRPDVPTDFFFVPAATAAITVERTLEIVSERLPRRFGLRAAEDIQVICPMHRPKVGTRNLNIQMQKLLNPARDESVIERGGWRWALADKAMQIENDYNRKVFNGDIGFVVELDADRKTLGVLFEGRERAVPYTFQELDALVPAWAISIHKSQGSEYPAVVIPLTMQHYVMLQRNLLYTAVTRGKRYVVLVGDERAVTRAVRASSANRRWTRLRQLLEEQIAERRPSL